MERTITIGKFDFTATAQEGGVVVATIYGGKELNTTSFAAKREVPAEEMLSTQGAEEDLFLCAHAIKETLTLMNMGIFPVPEDGDAFKADIEELAELMQAQAESFQADKH